MPARLTPMAPERWREPTLLTAILLLAATLRFWGLDQNGFSNIHYAATARSMTMSWHNFFFAAFDPAGFFSVDKPPVAFWVQAAAARLFGFVGLSVIAPQATEGVLAVALLYHLVRRRSSAGAALLAALVLAITPTSVAVDRSNCPDSCLVLVLLLAGWALILAAERSDWRFLLLSAALVGVAFNTKMLVAFGVLPTFALTYFLGTSLRPMVRLKHLIAAFLVVLATSASWGLVVDLTPADRRPYVGSSHDNSVLGLVLGHNGLERLFGAARGPSGVPRYDTRPGFGGPPGPFRLAGPELAGQVTWLFPLAAVGSLVVAASSRWRWPLGPDYLALLFWGGWLGSYAVAFSFARGIVHPYYLVLMAPPLAALVGIGTASLVRASGLSRWGVAAISTSLILTACWQAYILAAHPGWPSRLTPIVAGSVSVAVIGLVGALLIGSRRAVARRAAIGLGLVAVLIAPLAWSLTPVLAEGNPIIPLADPAFLSRNSSLAAEVVDPADVRPLVDFLRAHRSGERYLLATSNLMVAALIIVESGEPVMTTAGFMGVESVITPAKFGELVASRQVRYALLMPVARPGRSRDSTDDRAPAGARVVSPTLWRPRLPSPDIAASPARPTVAEDGPRNILRMRLWQMELYDFNPHARPTPNSTVNGAASLTR